jgi:hypothetical protein
MADNEGSGGCTTAIVCLLCLLGLEIVSRTVIADRAAGPSANQIAALDLALRQRRDDPSVVFLGGSHTQAGVAATRIEELLGWPRGSILNAALSNARPRDVLRLYRTHRPLFAKAKTAYVAVDVTYFNRNGLNRTSTPAPAWRRRATLADRLSFPGSFETRVDVIAGWFSNVWDQRTTWRQELIGLALRLRGTPRGARGSRLFDPLGRPAMGSPRAPLTTEALTREIDDAVDRRMFNYDFDSESFESLDELVRLLRDDGLEVVLVEMPMPAHLRALISERYAGAMARWTSEMRRRYGDLEMVRFSGDGYGTADFRDSDHLSEHGALRLAEELAPALRVRAERRRAPEPTRP